MDEQITGQELSMPPKRPRSPRGQSSRAAKRTKEPLETPARPANDDREGWKNHWGSQGQPWRTEPEINEERQKFLAERRAISPDIEKGIYPFKDIKLNRADVEWLLATHENGRGPVDWSDEKQRQRKGLDIRGADLRKVNLSGLPLSRLYGGLTQGLFRTPQEQLDEAAAHLEEALLTETHLEGSDLGSAHMERVDLRRAHLEQGLFRRTHLEQSLLRRTHLEGIDLFEAHLEGADFFEAHLQEADLRRAVFDSATNLNSVILGEGKRRTALLVDLHWGGANLSVVDWGAITVLGDDHRVKEEIGREKNRRTPLLGYRAAVRANRQIATLLREQGLNEEADHFTYRAQLLQRAVLRQQHKFLKYLGSWLLWLIAGYGYRPLRSLLIYLVLIFGFAIAYFFLGPQVGIPFSPMGSIVFSVTSFHGRGFFPGGSPGHSITLDDPLTVAAALEAVVGLLIEISFIATFTQRFFGK